MTQKINFHYSKIVGYTIAFLAGAAIMGTATYLITQKPSASTSEAASSRETAVCRRIISKMSLPPSYRAGAMQQCISEIENSLDY